MPANRVQYTAVDVKRSLHKKLKSGAKKAKVTLVQYANEVIAKGLAA